MRKIITTTMLTLDGVMQAPGASKEDESEGFKYGGWMFGWDEEADRITDKIQAEPFDLLLGRITYDILRDFGLITKMSHIGGNHIVRQKSLLFQINQSNSLGITQYSSQEIS